MSMVTIEVAQSRLAEIIEHLHPGEEVIITRDQQPIARLVGAAKPMQKPARRLGTLTGTVLYMAPDLDAPLEEFKEYME